METLTEKTDQQSSVAELQEKIGIFLAVLLCKQFWGLGLLVFLSPHSCPVFPTS